MFGFNASAFPGAAWLPLLLYLLDLRHPVLLGGALAAQWFSGSPAVSLMSGIALAGLSLAGLDAAARVRCLFKGAMWGALFAAVQWVPSLAAMVRAGPETVQVVAPVPLLKGLFIPPASGRPYMGLAALAAFAAGAVRLSRGGFRNALLPAASLAALVLALGPANGFYGRIPPLRLVAEPRHWLVAFTAFFTVTAALGLTALRPRWRSALIAVLVLELLSCSL